MPTATPERTETATPAERGMLLPCPQCGEAEASVRLDLADLDTCTCTECDGEFSLDELAVKMARWSGLLTWVKLFPVE